MGWVGGGCCRVAGKGSGSSEQIAGIRSLGETIESGIEREGGQTDSGTALFK